MENLSTFVRTLGNQFIRGRKIFTGIIGLEGTVLDGNTSAGTSGQVLSTTGSGVQWITVGSSNVGELDDLTDVQVGTPSNGQLLRYDSESGLWYNWTPNYLDTTDGLNDLNGVVITSAVSNQFLKYNGTNWVNANVLLSDLGDTSISSPSADQILVYGQPVGGTPGVNVWYNKTHSFLTTATNIDDLNNVIISTQTAGDILRYNGTNWVNVPFSNLENDTLDSVTDRGNTTTNTINVGGVITDYVEFDTSVTLGGDESQGYMAWNNDVDTVSVYPYDSTWFNIGQDMHWHVKNGTAHTIERGQVVMATGAVGNSSKIEAGLMVADGTVSSKYILGVAIRDIASGEFGKVASQGIIRGIDTSTLTEGSVLWCDPDTDGGLTSTEPDAPNLRLPVAFVVSSGTSGAIAVRITTGNVLHELHDVDAPSPSTGDLLRYSALTGIWENWTPTYISSFTEADPIFVASPAHGIASTDITNWNTAYGWGNHATAGYLTSLPTHNHDDRYYTETEVNTLLAGKAAVSHTHEIEDITGLSDSLDLKLETESDTLDSVTGRGNTTSNTIFVGSARGSSGTYGTGIYGDNSGASVQFGTSAAVDSLGIIGAYSSQFNINSKNGPLSFQYYGTEYMNISAAGALKLNSYGAGLLKTDANGNVTVDTNVYITADDQELTWEQSTKELSISDGNTVTLSGLASIADVEGYGYITTEVDTLNTVTTRGATTTNNISVGQAFSVGSNVGTTETYVQIGNGRTDSGYAYIDFVGDTTYTDYGLRIIRGNGGANTGSTITHRGTGSLTLQTSDSASIAFNTNAAERMRITSGGNVGIGTSTPAQKLDVVGKMKISDDIILAQINGRIDYDNGNEGGALRFWSTSAASERMRITSAGNVGIGTTSPNTWKLSVDSSTIYAASFDTSNNVGVVINGNDTTASQIIGFSNSASTYNALHLRTNSTSTSGLYINTSGNVGIGTTSPSYKLTVAGRISIENDILHITSASPKILLSVPGGGIDSQIYNDGAGNFIIGHGANSDTPGEKLRIDSTGNVGIGTTSPASKLQVNVGTDQNVAINSTGGVARISAYDDAVSNSVPLIINGSDLRFTNNTSEFVRITGGNVGIGTTSPSSKLHVYASSSGATAYQSGNDGLIVERGGRAAVSLLSPANSDSYLFFGNPTAGNAGYVGYENTANRLVIKSSDYISLLDSTGEAVRIDGGNVGIGTTSPGEKLTVDGNIKAGTEQTGFNGNSRIQISRASAASYIQFISNNTQEQGILFGDPDDTVEGSIRYHHNGDYMWFQTNNGEKMRIDASGNVGIGTTSPNTKLHVNVASTADYVINANDKLKVKGDGTLWWGSAADYGKLTWDTGKAVVRGESGKALSLGANGTQDTVYINTSQNVGIGTTSPAEKLSVATDTDASAEIGRAHIGSMGHIDYGGFSHIDQNGTSSYALLQSATGQTYINAASGQPVNFRIANSTKMVLASSGNVGIGTTSPSYKLDVNGSFNCTSMNVSEDITTSAGNVVLANDAGIYSFSDTVNAGADEAIFRISNTAGAQAFRVSFVCNTSNYSVAKTYEVVHAYAGTPVAFKVVDTGPYSGNDFDVTFTDAATNTGIECSIANNSSTVNANIVTTIFLAGSTTATTITEL